MVRLLNRLFGKPAPRRAAHLRPVAPPRPRVPETAATNYARMERAAMARDRRMIDYR